MIVRRTISTYKPDLITFINGLHCRMAIFFFQTPTVVLMDPNKQFHSFGEEAQKKYQELFQSDNHDHVTWYLFEKFNMKLLAKDSVSVLKYTQEIHATNQLLFLRHKHTMKLILHVILL